MGLAVSRESCAFKGVALSTDLARKTRKRVYGNELKRSDSLLSEQLVLIHPVNFIYFLSNVCTHAWNILQVNRFIGNSLNSSGAGEKNIVKIV